jgi:hypothetical protein
MIEMSNCFVPTIADQLVLYALEKAFVKESRLANIQSYENAFSCKKDIECYKCGCDALADDFAFELPDDCNYKCVCLKYAIDCLENSCCSRIGIRPCGSNLRNEFDTGKYVQGIQAAIQDFNINVSLLSSCNTLNIC